MLFLDSWENTAALLFGKDEAVILFETHWTKTKQTLHWHPVLLWEDLKTLDELEETINLKISKGEKYSWKQGKTTWRVRGGRIIKRKVLSGDNLSSGGGQKSSQHLFSQGFVRASLNMHGVWSRAWASGTPQTAQAAQSGPSCCDGALLSFTSSVSQSSSSPPSTHFTVSPLFLPPLIPLYWCFSLLSCVCLSTTLISASLFTA